ncbi:flagellar basal body P-ring formation chaperone FlgA [Desulfocicer niacini]
MSKTHCIKNFMALVLLIFWGVQGVKAASIHKTDNNENKYQTIDSARFREAFDQFVFQQSGRAPTDVIISKFKVLHNEPVPRGKVQIQIIQKGHNELVEYVRLKAVVTVNGSLENKVELCGWLDVFETVVCASRSLKRGTVIKAKDIYLERRNISSMMDDVLVDMSQVVGLMTKHNIKDNDTLKRWVLKQSPVVQRGDMVTILVQSGGLRVTVPGKVLDDGFKGQTVSVLNTMSSKKIIARVIDNLMVQVDI